MSATEQACCSLQRFAANSPILSPISSNWPPSTLSKEKANGARQFPQTAATAGWALFALSFGGGGKHFPCAPSQQPRLLATGSRHSQWKPLRPGEREKVSSRPSRGERLTKINPRGRGWKGDAELTELIQPFVANSDSF